MERLVFKTEGSFIIVENGRGKKLWKMFNSERTTKLINDYYRKLLFPRLK